MSEFVRMAMERSVVVRSLKVSALVGTILVIINQFDAVFGEESFNWIKIVLTYMVPYCVATYAAVRALQEQNARM
jgi:hypothetical protein